MSGFSNFLQQLNMGGDPMVTGSDGTMFGQSPGISPQAAQMPPQRERRSFLDTIGRISDVIARVGGAEAMYQPTLDAQQDRIRQVDLEALKRQQIQQQMSIGGENLAELQRAKVGATVKGLQAIKRAGGDISRALPLLGERSGMSPEEIAALGNVLQSDANALDGLASMFGSSNEKYGGNIVYGVDNATGKLAAFQPGIEGAPARSVLPEGFTPIDPLKFVDVGDRQVGVGTRSGAPLRILPKGQTPDNRANNQTRITVAGMRPTAGGRAGGAANSKAQARMAQLPAIENAINTLEASIGPLEEKGWSGAVGGYVPSSLDAESDVFETNLGLVRQLIRGITKVEGEGSISDYETKLQQATLPGRTQTKEGRRQAISNLRTLVRDLQKGYQQVGKAPAAAPARNAPARRTSGNKPSVSNW
jgi:hypothetical protein